jgi:tRNA pseudouridine(55) synthase
VTGPDGVAVVDKPAGWTSHDVVAKSRGLLGTRKVGHSGTLDPDATGVLVLGVGRATRLLRYLSPLGKAYDAEIVLGTETSTLDAAGEVTATHDMAGVTLADARRAVDEHLTGAILQVPPMVSALKVDGRRLHELAREGIEVERQARPVTVHSFTVDEVPGEPGVLRASVACSSGTYVRTLAADLGHLLGGGAHLRAGPRWAPSASTAPCPSRPSIPSTCCPSPRPWRTCRPSPSRATSPSPWATARSWSGRRWGSPTTATARSRCTAPTAPCSRSTPATRAPRPSPTWSSRPPETPRSGSGPPATMRG